MWKFKKNKPTKGYELPGIATLLKPAHCFTYDEIVDMTNNFTHLLGRGVLYDVYSGVEHSGLRVAVKKTKTKEYYCSRYACTEVEILARVHHRNLVSLVGLCEEGNEMMLVLEYAAGGPLDEALLDRNRELTWRKRLQIAVDAARGVEYLHTGCKPSVIHGDIQSRSILLDENLDAKLTRFGLTKTSGVDGSEYGEISSCTPGYIAPEYVCTGRVSKKCDVYSFGVVLFELITGKPVVVTLESDRCHLITWVMPKLMRGDIDDVLDPLLKGDCNIESVWKVVGLAKAATQEDPKARPDMTDVLRTLEAALTLEISEVDMASNERLWGDHVDMAASDPCPRFYYLPDMGSDSSSWTELETLAEAANGTTGAEANSSTGPAPHFTSSPLTTLEAAQPSSAMEVQPSCNIDETTLVTTTARRFTYNEILSITENFGRVIGQGGFATVYFGQLQEGGLEVAVKKIKESRSDSSNELLGEVKLLMRIHHRNLVSLVGFCEDRNEIILVSEYMASGNLSSILKGETARAGELTWKKRLQIALGAATGLEYLHTGCKPAVIHGDIKSSNILLDKNLDAKLADFGMSKASECSAFQMSKVFGTRGYIDPEYYKTQTLTKKSDVYSFGVVLFELITGKPAIMKDESNEWCHITDWLMPMLIRRDIESPLDPILQGNCNITSVMEVASIARAAVARHPSKRPEMGDIVNKLKAALRIEVSWVGHGSENSN